MNNNSSNILPKLLYWFPSIASRPAIERLLHDEKNALSFESAAACISEIDAKTQNNILSTESQEPVDDSSTSDFETNNAKKYVLENSINNHFANVKFASLVDYAKQDDSMLYTEFAEVDSARNRIASEIVAKYENEFNSFIVALKATEGTDKSILDKLLQTKIHVNEIN